MSSNLEKLKRELKSFARRTKTFKYTDSALLIFLLMGLIGFVDASNLFSAQDEIANQRKTLSNSMSTLRQSVKKSRGENNKLLTAATMELIQLMEQGDHVVKVPWSSWQFGTGFEFNDWHGTYKGFGDKPSKYAYEGIFKRGSSVFERTTSPISPNYGRLVEALAQLPSTLSRNNNGRYSQTLFETGSSSFNRSDIYSASSHKREGIEPGYGLVRIRQAQEPIVAINVDASIRPKVVDVNIPNLGIQAPSLNALNVPNLIPPSLNVPAPDPIVVPDKTPNIVVNPTIDFRFRGRSVNGGGYSEANRRWNNGRGDVYWSGWNPDTNQKDQRSVWKYSQVDSRTPDSERVPNIFYVNAVTRSDPNARWRLWDVREVHAAGDPSWGGTPSTSRGTEVIHTVWNGDIDNVHATLHGYSTFIAAEGWHSGKVHLTNSTVNILGEYNSVFYGYPGSYYAVGINNNDYHSYGQRGEYSGDLRININSDNNYIYSILGVQGAFKYENASDYNITGNNNIVYLGIGYSPNFENLKDGRHGEFTEETISSDINSTENLTPVIKLGTSGGININGNRNVGLMFENLYTDYVSGVNLPYNSIHPFPVEIAQDGWKKSAIGIYQGEIEIGLKIGENSESKRNIGVLARSGQRPLIMPTMDLGTPDYWLKQASIRIVHDTRGGFVSKGVPEYMDDMIHNLEIAKAEIYFGKYSVDGISFVADRGTVMDIARPDKTLKTDDPDNTSHSHPGEKRTAYTEVTPSTVIKDTGASRVKSSVDDTENEAATGTIIGYSTGVWNNQYMNEWVSDTNSEPYHLKDKPSEINFYAPIIMSGRAGVSNSGINPSIALFADNHGIINAKKKVTANGYGSILAYAMNEGVINVDEDLEAKDAWAASDDATKPYLYTNVGAYSGTKGVVNVTGNVDIHGIGAMASGTQAIVNLNGTGNTIRTGTKGGLVAIQGGVVNFKGGTITHAENEEDDHDSSTPMFADATSHINFTGPTTINIANGILMPGTTADYEATTPNVTKYNGMNNVTINLTGDDVVLRSNNGHAPFHWTGGSIVGIIKNDMKLAAFNDNGHVLKIYYINGQTFIDTDVNLDDNTNDFNRIKMSRELVTISPGVVIRSSQGKGLAMGSNSSATSVNDSGYINKGTLNITGGNIATTAGLNTSYGFMDNQGAVNLDSGIGLYGVNGSKFLNNSNGTIHTTGQGVGMAAFASATSGLQDYGTDKKIKNSALGLPNGLTASDKVLDMENKGVIEINGAQSVGIFGQTNEVAATRRTPATPAGLLTAQNGLITNTGRIIMNGDESVGILAKRVTVNLGGTGSSDIIVGNKGIGVYTEKTPVNIVSATGIEVKDKGVGVFVKNDGSTISGSPLEIKYTGAANESAAGIFYEGGTNHTNTVDVNMVNRTSDNGIVGIFINNSGTLTNNATIKDFSGKGYGIYSQGGDVVNNGTLVMGEAGKGILSTGGNVTLAPGSTITLGQNNAIGVYALGSGSTVTAQNGANMTIGDGSYGFVNKGNGNTITSNVASQSLPTNTVYVYSTDGAGTVTNNTQLVSTGSANYGIYAAGNIVNDADINFSNGIGNVGIYSINGGTAVNKIGRKITVGASNPDPRENQYAIGMAAGYVGDSQIGPYTGNITNYGTIDVNGELSIGMYGATAGTTVTNNGTINLNASNTTGMYLDNGAYGINNGIIKSNGTGLKKVIGVVVKSGSTIENNGVIDIDAKQAVGLLTKRDESGNNPGIIRNYGTLNIRGVAATDVYETPAREDIGKNMAGVNIHAPAGSSVATITVNGVPVVPEIATTTAEEYTPMEVSTIGMYIDTSNKRFTTPVTGLRAFDNLTNADLIIGTEAAQNTTSKYIQISERILKPYNDMIVANPQIEKWNIYSGSLTWMASISQNQTDGTIQNAYLAKIPYTAWAGDSRYSNKRLYSRNSDIMSATKPNTFNFLDGLEQRYGVEGIGTRENQLFQRINNIGNNEEVLFFQAIDEMMGHQYANVQHRINQTGQILDKEITGLKHDYRNPTKQNNKIKAFGQKNEYRTNTAGVIDYDSNAYGVAYIHEDETVKMGNRSGWYAGIVTNQFKFKDIGKSKENQNVVKAGVFKTFSPKKDYNGALQWTIGADAFLGRNEIKRRYLVVNDVFDAKGTYNSYGAAIKTDLGYDIRMSERMHLRPYGAFKMEYGRFSDIKESNGQMRLQVKGDDYYSIKPELGVEFKFIQPLAVRTKLSVGLTAAYENELGKIDDVTNKGKVRYTTADWFDIRGEKEDRKGNGKFDLNIGVDNTRFGVTVNGGYDTKGKNVRGGIGFRVIY